MDSVKMRRESASTVSDRCGIERSRIKGIFFDGGEGVVPLTVTLRMRFAEETAKSTEVLLTQVNKRASSHACDPMSFLVLSM